MRERRQRNKVALDTREVRAIIMYFKRNRDEQLNNNNNNGCQNVTRWALESARRSLQKKGVTTEQISVFGQDKQLSQWSEENSRGH